MGEVFAGRYELVDVLDSGGMGMVWRVWDLRDRTYRAGKMLRQSDGASLLRFVRETGTRVDHPHVVAPTGWSAEDDRVLFAMPLMTGGSVATLLGDYGPLPAGFVRAVLLQLLDALDAVHRAGIVHRDVKPANLLLESTGTEAPYVRLSDFGIAAVRDEPRLTRSSEVVLTPGYAAPEVHRGEDPHPRHDLYAVGRVAEEMLTGLRPGRSEGAADCGILSPFCDRLVATDPQERFGSAEQALTALRVIEVPEPLVDPIEVFNHLPPLPEGWGPEGPAKADRPRAGLREQTRLRLIAAGLAATGIALIMVAAALLT